MTDSGKTLPDTEALLSYDLAFLDAYIAAPVDDSVDLRERYCFLCQATADQDDASRLAACRAKRCGLRDAQAYREEWDWNKLAILSVVRAIDAISIPQQVLDLINNRVIEAGCVVIVLAPAEKGATGWDLAGGTLRGQVHKALLRWCSIMGGHPLVPMLSESDAEDVRRYRRDMRIRRVQLMGAYGMSQLAIVRVTGEPRATVQRWLRLPQLPPLSES